MKRSSSSGFCGDSDRAGEATEVAESHIAADRERDRPSAGCRRRHGLSHARLPRGRLAAEFYNGRCRDSNRIADLSQSLARPAREAHTADRQAPDGSWAPELNIWYLKLYYSVDHVSQCRNAPQYPLTFLDRINSPEMLNAVLDADLLDDFTRTGVFNREELDETFSALARMLLTIHGQAVIPSILALATL